MQEKVKGHFKIKCKKIKYSILYNYFKSLLSNKMFFKKGAHEKKLSKILMVRQKKPLSNLSLDETIFLLKSQKFSAVMSCCSKVTDMIFINFLLSFFQCLSNTSFLSLVVFVKKNYSIVNIIVRVFSHFCKCLYFLDYNFF